VPKTAQVLSAFRVALLSPAVRLVVNNSVFIGLAFEKLALKVGVAARDVGLFIPVLRFGLLIPVVVPVVPLGVFPLAPLVTLLFFVYVTVVLINEWILITVEREASALLPQLVVITVFFHVDLLPVVVFADVSPLISFISAWCLLFSAVIAPSVALVVATSHVAGNDSVLIIFTPIVDDVHLPFNTV